MKSQCLMSPYQQNKRNQHYCNWNLRTGKHTTLHFHVSNKICRNFVWFIHFHESAVQCAEPIHVHRVQDFRTLLLTWIRKMELTQWWVAFFMSSFNFVPKYPSRPLVELVLISWRCWVGQFGMTWHEQWLFMNSRGVE